MAITEAQRFEMQLALRRVLGDEMGDRLMEHLPPAGWSEVALSRDVDSVRRDVDALRRDLESFRAEIMREIAHVRSSIRVLTGAMITVSVAMLGLMVQLNLSIAQL